MVTYLRMLTNYQQILKNNSLYLRTVSNSTIFYFPFIQDFDNCYYDYDTFTTLFVLHDKQKLEYIQSVIVKDPVSLWNSLFFKIKPLTTPMGRDVKARSLFWFWDFKVSRIRNYYGEQVTAVVLILLFCNSEPSVSF